MQVARDHMLGKSMLDHALERDEAGHTTVFEVMRISKPVEE